MASAGATPGAEHQRRVEALADSCTVEVHFSHDLVAGPIVHPLRTPGVIIDVTNGPDEDRGLGQPDQIPVNSGGVVLVSVSADLDMDVPGLSMRGDALRDPLTARLVHLKMGAVRPPSVTERVSKIRDPRIVGTKQPPEVSLD